MRLIGIDPGETWLGFAMVDCNESDRVLYAETRVLHIPARGMVRAVHEAMYGLPAVVIAEDYHVRPVAHQRFTTGQTLRLLGALEYAVACNSRSTWDLQPAGSWQKELPSLTNNFLTDWMVDWWDKSNEWDHALSAWRVLFRHVMMTYPGLHAAMRSHEVQGTYTKTTQPVIFSGRGDRSVRGDLTAPTARWRLPRRFQAR